MKAICLSAALLVIGGAAYADQSYSFEIDGRTIRIERPADCTDLSCLSISIPGIYESAPRRRRSRDDAPTAAKPDAPRAAPARPAATPDQPAVSPVKPAATATAPSADPARDAAEVPGASPAAPETPAAAPVAPAAPQSPAVATAPAVPEPAVEAPAEPVTASPVGLWLTEKKEGRIRIEPCGANLCGYEVDEQTGASGRKILIDMEPDGDQWAGRIHDPKSGGRYDSTIALNGPDRLRVQGCAFGGMFCGGQTWSRVN